ncbi:unnamed protein product [Timema podura]|uniref:Uncharacterized protein n=1 Tax=Timema podura TaxID=61482 RepID=A0ABN7NF86_TIMPD|nr:unnamed protein product [Timema podura]
MVQHLNLNVKMRGEVGGDIMYFNVRRDCLYKALCGICLRICCVVFGKVLLTTVNTKTHWPLRNRKTMARGIKLFQITPIKYRQNDFSVDINQAPPTKWYEAEFVQPRCYRGQLAKRSAGIIDNDAARSNLSLVPGERSISTHLLIGYNYT